MTYRTRSKEQFKKKKKREKKGGNPVKSGNFYKGDQFCTALMVF